MAMGRSLRTRPIESSPPVRQEIDRRIDLADRSSLAALRPGQRRSVVHDGLAQTRGEPHEGSPGPVFGAGPSVEESPHRCRREQQGAAARRSGGRDPAGAMSQVTRGFGHGGVVEAARFDPAGAQGRPAIEVVPEKAVEHQIVLEQQQVVGAPFEAGREGSA